MSGLFHFQLFFSVLLATFTATYFTLRILQNKSVLDHPNERSSHTTPTPRGGGLAVVIVLVPAWVAIGLTAAQNMTEVWTLMGGALLLAAISWVDDLHGVSPVWRLFGQIGAVSLVLTTAPGQDLYFAGLLPPLLDTISAGLLWVWFINLFNFMDGIDGISGTEAFCIGAGISLIALTVGIGGNLALYGLAIAASALGFLWWNWHPAKVFLGDVGSIFLGFLLGWLLLTLSAKGQWAAALILPLYYLADATITLVRRGFRGEKIWHAHKEHFYQRAVQNGFKHSNVALIILLINIALVALAMGASLGWIWQALISACIFVLSAFFLFSKKRRSRVE